MIPMLCAATLVLLLLPSPLSSLPPPLPTRLPPPLLSAALSIPLLLSPLASFGAPPSAPPISPISDAATYSEISTLISKYHLQKGRLPASPPASPDYLGLLRSLDDKYSRYLSKSEYAAIQKYDLIGVGATLLPDDGGKLVVGAPPIPGSAAARAGIPEGSRILAVNGTPVGDKSAFEVVELVGPADDAVEFTYRAPGGSGDPVTVRLPRAVQKLKDPVT